MSFLNFLFTTKFGACSPTYFKLHLFLNYFSLSVAYNLRFRELSISFKTTRYYVAAAVAIKINLQNFAVIYKSSNIILIFPSYSIAVYPTNRFE